MYMYMHIVHVHTVARVFTMYRILSNVGVQGDDIYNQQASHLNINMYMYMCMTSPWAVTCTSTRIIYMYMSGQ